MTEIACRRCSACCHDSKGKDCKYLVRFKNSKITSCRIYNMIYQKNGKRALVVIEKDDNGKEHYCVQRKNSQYDYPNCPYNQNRPMCPFPR